MASALSSRWSPTPPSSAGFDGRRSPASELILLEGSEASVGGEEASTGSAAIAGAVPARQNGSGARTSSATTAREARAEAGRAGAEVAALGAKASDYLTPESDDSSQAMPSGAGTDDVDGALRLTLDQLGVGASNPFRSHASEAAPLKQDANARLQASLRQGSVELDRRRQLGPEGPVLRAAHQLLSSNEVLLETSATVDVRVDAGGRVTSIHLSSASSQSQDWRKLAEGLLASLGPARLKLVGGEGLDFQLRLASTLQLPSGAAPGVRLSALGQTLRDGEGASSTSLTLSPTAPLRAEEVFDTSGRHLDSPIRFQVGLLTLKGDVADVAAGPRRVVQVLLVASNTAP